MADDYQFKEAFSDAKKIRRAIEVGTDADGNPILENVTRVEAIGETSDAADQDTSTDGTLVGYIQGALQYLSDIKNAVTATLDVAVQGTVTTTDDGNFNVTLDAQNAGLAQESTLADQESYDVINVGPATDSVFTTAYNGILLASVNGDVEIQTGDGNTKTIPQSFFTAGQVLPITVAEISSANTTQTVSDIMLVRN
jgi:hypothetical protein